MSTSNEVSSIIANAISTIPATSPVVINNELAAQLAEAKAENDRLKAAAISNELAAQLAAAKAENDRLKAAKNQATTKLATPTVSTTSAPPANQSAADTKLLAIVEQFKSPARTDGKPAGSLAVKIHAYFHACGIPESRVREILESAVSRKVVSRMTIPTKKGTRMMIYFDYRVKPSFASGPSITDAEKTAMAVFTA